MYLQQVTLTAVATPVIPKAVVPANSRSFSVFTIQNNSAAAVRVGDSTVSATRGILLDPSNAGAAGGAYTITPALQFTGDLTEFYLFGASGSVIDLMIHD